MANIFDVSKFILDTVGGSVSTMKLQKLCYYCQAWALVWNQKKPLFAQNFQAWKDGPVCYELFRLHQGKFAISSNDIPFDAQEGNLTEEEKSIIIKVVDFYGKRSADWLSALTHEEKPWQETREQCGVSAGEACQAVISNKSLYDYYSNL